MESEKKNSIQKKYIIGFLILLLIFISLTVYFWRKANVLGKNPGEAETQEILETVEKVSKLILLPQDETPTLATVSDPEKLKDQPFFVNAKVGFKVLIYTKSQKAILYDPFKNLIIEVAPIDIDGSALQE